MNERLRRVQVWDSGRFFYGWFHGVGLAALDKNWKPHAPVVSAAIVENEQGEIGAYALEAITFVEEAIAARAREDDRENAAGTGP